MACLSSCQSSNTHVNLWEEIGWKENRRRYFIIEVGRRCRGMKSLYLVRRNLFASCRWHETFIDRCRWLSVHIVICFMGGRVLEKLFFEKKPTRQNAPIRASNKKGVKQKLLNPLILLVHQEGFGPPTYGFVVRCSIQLSYWCKQCRKDESVYPNSFVSSSLFLSANYFLFHSLY